MFEVATSARASEEYPCVDLIGPDEAERGFLSLFARDAVGPAEQLRLALVRHRVVVVVVLGPVIPNDIDDLVEDENGETMFAGEYVEMRRYLGYGERPLHEGLSCRPWGRMKQLGESIDDYQLERPGTRIGRSGSDVLGKEGGQNIRELVHGGRLDGVDVRETTRRGGQQRVGLEYLQQPGRLQLGGDGDIAHGSGKTTEVLGQLDGEGELKGELRLAGSTANNT